jgi:hypothetical protein
VPRFVVLEHDTPLDRHWDFMLETPSGLATWSLAQTPDAAPTVFSRQLPDHRPAFLEYEGPISDNRGSVTRWDHGSYQLRQYDRDEVSAVVAGEKLIGAVTLRRTAEDPGRWVFSFAPFV